MDSPTISLKAQIYFILPRLRTNIQNVLPVWHLCEDMDWIQIVQDVVHWRALVNTAMNF